MDLGRDPARHHPLGPPLHPAGFDRRRFLQLGGATLLSSAVLASMAGCSGSPPPRKLDPSLAAGTTTTTIVPPDAGLLRLASSLEHYLVGLYMTVLGSGLVKTAALVEAAKYFAGQHSDHAGFDEGATARAGGQPFNSANAAVAATLRPRVDALQTEADVVKLVYDVEQVVAATYFAAIGGFKNRTLDAQAASIMGVETRHMAVWGMILAGLPLPLPSVPRRADALPYPAAGFQTTDGAIPPGTGV